MYTQSKTRQIRLCHHLQTVLLLLVMILMLSLVSQLLLGENLWIWVVSMVVISLMVLPGLSPVTVMRMLGARPLNHRQFSQLYQITQQLTLRAGLDKRPRLYVLPGHNINALTAGDQQHPVIAISEGALQLLNSRELAGVLAHEISHIRHRDIYLMHIAQMISWLTSVLSLAGIVLTVILLPLIVTGLVGLSLTGLLLLMVLPALTLFLQLALSRVREYDADFGAAELTGDPLALASALNKILQQQAQDMRGFLTPTKNSILQLLRSHPVTHNRIQRLLQFQRSVNKTPAIRRYRAINDWQTAIRLRDPFYMIR